MVCQSIAFLVNTLPWGIVLADRPGEVIFFIGARMQGKRWIKLYAQCLENGWLKNHKLWVFWSYCLLKAAPIKTKTMVGFRQIDLEPGQFIFTRRQASIETGLSEREVRTCMSHLESSQNVTSKTTNKMSLVTIVNWASYQGSDQQGDQQNDQQATSKRPTNTKNTPPLPSSISRILEYKNKGYSPSALKLVDEFLETLDDSQKKRLNRERNLKDCETLLKNYSEEEIKRAFLYGRQGFWADKTLSIGSLNTLDRSGVRRINKFLEATKGKTTPSQAQRSLFDEQDAARRASFEEDHRREKEEWDREEEERKKKEANNG